MNPSSSDATVTSNGRQSFVYHILLSLIVNKIRIFIEIVSVASFINVFLAMVTIVIFFIGAGYRYTVILCIFGKRKYNPTKFNTYSDKITVIIIRNCFFSPVLPSRY